MTKGGNNDKIDENFFSTFFISSKPDDMLKKGGLQWERL
jgi:hypothetical protein